MTSAAQTALEPRWTCVVRSAATLGEDLGLIGMSVGPRTGPGKRSQGEEEDYVLRRFLAALKLRGGYPFPWRLRAESTSRGEPDFVLACADGRAVGIEVTEAGEEKYQAWLAHTENAAAAGAAIDLPFEASTKRTVDELVRAIRSKVGAFDRGAYRRYAACHLVVYDNTAWGGFLDKPELVRGVRASNELNGRFETVNLVFGELLVLDIFGGAERVDVSKEYEVDFAGWAERQAELLRQGETQTLDRVNLAEEVADLSGSLRRALRSHLRNLIVHLLKIEFQPARRSRSWSATVANARIEIRDLLAENPSLQRELVPGIAQQYEHARKIASRETGLPLERFPGTCPYTPQQLIDDDFLPQQAAPEEP